jgi:hypothetical protein
MFVYNSRPVDTKFKTSVTQDFQTCAYFQTTQKISSKISVIFPFEIIRYDLHQNPEGGQNRRGKDPSRAKRRPPE